MEFKIGDLVRRSGSVINRARDYWNNCGSYPQKSIAKDRLDALVAERGKVTALIPATDNASGAIEVTWDNGSVSQCLPYLVTKA